MKKRIEFKSNTTDFAKHIPTGEEWYIIGISKDMKRCCVAGWPPSTANLSDCTDFEEVGQPSDDELKHRKRYFGDEWI